MFACCELSLFVRVLRDGWRGVGNDIGEDGQKHISAVILDLCFTSNLKFCLEFKLNVVAKELGLPPEARSWDDNKMISYYRDLKKQNRKRRCPG